MATPIDAAKRLIELGQYERAADVLRKVLARDSNDIDAWYLLGVLHYTLDQPDQAQNAFSNVLALNGEHANAHYYLGELSMKRGDRSGALDHYGAAMAADPNHKGAAARIEAFANQVRAAQPSAAPRAQQDASYRPVSANPSQPSPDGASRPPRQPKSWHDSVVGVVENLQYRTEAAGHSMNARTIYTFRLQSFDESGQRGALFGVDLRGLGIKGGISNGDWVEIDRKAKRRGEAFEVHSLRNLTTGGEVKGRRFRL